LLESFASIKSTLKKCTTPELATINEELFRFIETKGYAENDESVVAKNLLAYFAFLADTKKRESQAHFANLFSSSQYPTAMTFIIMHCPELFKEITSFVKSI
jgi:hypothetical protein